MDFVNTFKVSYPGYISNVEDILLFWKNSVCKFTTSNCNL